MTRISELDRLAGVDKNLVIVPDPSTDNQNSTVMLGTMKGFTPHTRVQVDTRSRRYEFEERL